jgi:hypothetical protein
MHTVGDTKFGYDRDTCFSYNLCFSKQSWFSIDSLNFQEIRVEFISYEFFSLRNRLIAMVTSHTNLAV